MRGYIDATLQLENVRLLEEGKTAKFNFKLIYLLWKTFLGFSFIHCGKPLLVPDLFIVENLR